MLLFLKGNSKVVRNRSHGIILAAASAAWSTARCMSVPPPSGSRIAACRTGNTMGVSVDELVEMAASGDKVAMGRLLMLYDEPLRQRIGRHITADLQGALSAEDVLQETYVEAYRHMEGFEPQGRQAFGRWLTTIADRKLVDAVRALRAAKRPPRHREQRIPDDRSSSFLALGQLADKHGKTPSRIMAGEEAVGAVQSALAALPDACRQALWLRYIEGKPVEDVAEALHRTKRAIHQLCYRGLILLREEMGSRSRYLGSSQ